MYNLGGGIFMPSVGKINIKGEIKMAFFKEVIKTGEGVGCTTVGAQNVEVNVPVSVRAGANVGDVTVQCSGTPVITAGTARYRGVANAVSEFVISQNLRVDVPVSFNAAAEVGTALSSFSEVADVATTSTCAAAQAASRAPAQTIARPIAQPIARTIAQPIAHTTAQTIAQPIAQTVVAKPTGCLSKNL
jgi:hypothetical protein